jgi:hypothetical protein
VSSGAEQDDLERMLAASRDLRSHYHAAAQEEPSAQVDDAIRAQARRTVGARPRSAASPFGSSWRVPLSIAAVLVLSVTLTVIVTRQDKHLPSADQSSARETVPERAPAMTPAEPQPQNAAKPSANTKEDALGRREKARPMAAPEQKKASEKDLYQAPAQPPSFDEGAASGLKKQAEPFPAAPPAPVPRAEPAPSSAPEPKVAAPATAAVPQQERDATATSDAGLALRERSFADKRQDAPPKPSSSNAVRAEGKLKSEELAGGLSAARVVPQRRQAPAAAVEQPQADTASAPTPAPWESDPQAWLRHIETLVREKRMTEARDGFKAFRQRYPAYPLPAEFPLREP